MFELISDTENSINGFRIDSILQTSMTTIISSTGTTLAGLKISFIVKFISDYLTKSGFVLPVNKSATCFSAVPVIQYFSNGGQQCVSIHYVDDEVQGL
jgi:hypothetical protein